MIIKCAPISCVAFFLRKLIQSKKTPCIFVEKVYFYKLKKLFILNIFLLLDYYRLVRKLKHSKCTAFKTVCLLKYYINVGHKLKLASASTPNFSQHERKIIQVIFIKYLPYLC